MKRFLLVLLLGALVAGCGTIYEKDPVGIGPGRDEMKISPCACLRVFQG
ncbi:MAG: hypothetical protein FWD33_02510 [Alphaproteobacteria bacterium]|nr:hypothetical protein [Alphaproteobacteria bacterium]